MDDTERVLRGLGMGGCTHVKAALGYGVALRWG